MKNIVMDGHEANDIRQQVAKVLRGLGNPEPPLCLDDVRELQRLDRRYFSGNDQTAVREVVSRLMVAGKQLLRRPTLLIDAIQKAQLSALWIPDKKRILIDETKPKLKHRWSETHEIGHSLIPWHEHLLLGDNEFSLHPTCHSQLEAEANYAAGQLLFLQNNFVTQARDSSLGLAAIKSLKTTFGNTLSSTLWRYVEELGGDLPLVGLISDNPHKPGDNFDPEKPCRHFIQSVAFQNQFSMVSEKLVFSKVRGYCGRQSGGPLGESQVELQDDNGDMHVFHFESFSNRYDVLTFGRHVCKCGMAVAVR